MEIRIEPHTLLRASKRGVSAVEIEEALRNGVELPAKHGRRACAKVFEFNGQWKGRHFPQKRVEVIYIVQNCVIITVTVYCYYGEWRERP